MKFNKKRINALLIVITILIETIANISVFAQNTSSEISIGDYIYLGKYNGKRLIWRCVDIDDNGPLMLLSETIENKSFSASQTGMQTDDLSELTDLSDFEMRNQYGSNRWSLSAVRQWLNSEAENVEWENVAPSDELCYGNVGYADETGFLADDNFTSDEKFVIKSVAQKNILSAYDEGEATGGSVGFVTDYSSAFTKEKYDSAFNETVVDRIFCMDTLQFESAKTNAFEYILPSSEQEQYWLRTPVYEKSYAVNYLTIYAAAIDTVANNSEIGVRPAFYINMEALNIQSGTGEESSPYVIYGSAPVGIEEIKFNETEITLGKGMSYKAEVTVLPENANDKTIIWKSDDESVAAVSNDGTIRAVGVGETKVRASSVDNTVSAECKVIVTERESVEFADSAFKQAVIDAAFGGDREISDNIYADEVSDITSLDIRNKNITDLKGIEYFASLQVLNCSGNRLQQIDLSGNAELATLDCTNSQVIGLNVANNKRLTHLYVAQNNISSLNLSANVNLIWLDCSNNNLSDVDITENIEYLYISGNGFESIDTGKCKKLKSFECQNNRLSELNLQANTALTNLNCSNNMLRELNLDKQANIRQVLVKENRLESIDVTANKKLTYLDCSRNYFKSKSNVSGIDESRTTLVYYPQYLVLIPVESVRISDSSLMLKIGETANLTAEVLPQGATNKNIRWSCDNTAIANISESGRVTAYTPGECTITVTTDDGGFTDTCSVKVIDTTAPTTPTNLKAEYVTGSGTQISWRESTDNVRVLRYDIYRNNVFLKSVTQNSFTDFNLTESAEYLYQVVAVDTSENKSDFSESIRIIPKAPKITHTTPANGDTFGGLGTQRIAVYYSDTNNSTGTTMSIQIKDDVGEWTDVSFDVTYTQSSSGSYNIIYAEFDKENLSSGDYNFRFIVTDKDNNSDSVENMYTIDRTPPQKIEDFAAVTGEENIVLSWATAKDADVVRYEIYRAGTIAGNYQLYATVYGRTNTSFIDKQVFVNEVYYYKVLAVDAFEQKGELTEPVWATPTKDETIPTITKFLPANNSTLNGSKTISVSAEDNIKVASIELQYSTDEKNWNSYELKTTDSAASFNFDTTAFADGEIYLRAIAYDVAGNASNGRPVYTYKIDNTGPVKVTNVRKAAATATTITLSWDDVSDKDFGYFAVEQKNQADGGYFRIGTTSTTLGMNIYNLAPDTEYTYRVVAYDILGNRGTESNDITVRTNSDTTAPVITQIYPGANRFSKMVDMRITAGDDYLVDRMDIEYSYDLNNWLKEAELTLDAKQKNPTFSYRLDLINKNEGSLYIRPIAFDMAGNSSDKSSSAPFVEYYVDRTPPAKPEGLTLISENGYIEIRWKQGTEDDLAGYTIYRSDTADGEYTAIKSNLKQVNYIDKNVKLGKVYYYKLAVSDTAGNMSDVTSYVYGQMLEDNEAPVIYSFSPSDGYVISKANTINVLVGDNHRVSTVTLEYLLADNEWTTLETKTSGSSSQVISFSINRDIFTDGIYSFRAVATDESGNVSEYSAVYQYTVDDTAPIVSNLICTSGEESITVKWDSGMEPDLSGFYIYRRTENSGYSKIGSLSAKNTKSYEYVNYNLNSAAKYMYKVVALDSVGNQSYSESGWLYPNERTPEVDTISPIISMNYSSVMEVGIEEYFDASASSDNVGIVSYVWDFGDGTTSKKPKAAHSYANTGTYNVSITVSDAAGNRSIKTGIVKVEERKRLGTVTINVKDTYGNAVSGAGVYFNLGKENVCIYGTNAKGQVTIREYEGIYPVGVYCDGYLPAKLDVQIIKNTDNALYDVVIEQKKIIIGELTHERMTLEEIIAAGIDPYQPENQNVYKFEIVLTYGSEEYTASGITKNTSDPIKLTVKDSKDSVNREVYAWNVGGGSGGGSGGGTGGSYRQKPKTIIAVVEMPGEASWLKEFFDVHLHIENQADEEFAIDDSTVTLNYPNGLTLMNGLVEKYSESKNVSIGTIKGQEAKDIYWILKGDKAGKYDISADFTGTLRDFNEKITARFEAAKPIEVYGSENLFLDIWAEDSIAPGADSAIRVGLTNEGLVDVYLPNISLDDLELIRNFKTNNGLIVQTSRDVLAPGESIWADYRIPRNINETLEKNSDKEFYLYNKVVNSIGGNASLQHRFNIVPAYTISPDIINVYTKDSTGALQPLNLIETKRGLSAKIPDIVIETLVLDENMQFVPASRQITIEDEYLIKKGKNLEEIYGVQNLSKDNDKFVVNTNSDGMFTLKGYDIKFALKTIESYNIKISSTRAVSKQIPVVMRDVLSETSVVEGHVYYRGKGTQSPLADAEVTIGDKVTTTDEKGRFYFKAIGIGKNNITIKKEGYEELNELLTVSEDEKIDYYLNKIADPNAPHIKSVKNTMFTTQNGNATVIPAEKIEGYIQFVITPELKGESFLKYKYYILDEDGNTVSDGDVPASVFSYNLKELEPGQQLLFSLITKDADGNEKESAPYDTNIIIAEPPNFLESIALKLSDMDDFGSFEEISLPDKKLPISFTSESQKITQRSLFESAWINTDDENVKKASYLLEGLRLDSKTEVEFPLKTEYNLDGTFKISFGAEVTHKPQNMSYYKSVGEYLSYSNSNLYYESSTSSTQAGIFDLSSLSEGEDKVLDIGGDAVLDFTMKYVPELRDWKCVLGITISGRANVTVFKAEVPVVFGVAGGYADVAVGGEAEARWEPLTTYLSDVIDLADFSMSILPTKLSGGIEAKGGVGVYAFDADVMSGGVYAKLNADLHLLPQQKMVVEYDFGTEGKVLLWEPNKSYLNDKFEVRFFDDQKISTKNLIKLMSTDENTMNISSAKNKSTWNGSGAELKSDVFDGSKPRLLKLNDGRILMVFADFDAGRNANNPVQMMYSVYENNTWSDPQPIYDDGTVGLYPQLTNDANGNVYASWVNINEELTDVSTMTLSGLRKYVFPKMQIVTAKFEPETNKWSVPQCITSEGCFKKSPQIASDGTTTVNAWIQNKSNYEYGTDECKDTIGYSISGNLNDNGELEVDTDLITSMTVNVFQNKVYLAYTKYVDGCAKAFVRIYDGSWSGERAANENAYEDKYLRAVVVDGELYLYYVNNNKVYRYNIITDKSECIAYHDSINGILEMEVADNGNVLWISNYNGYTQAFMVNNDADTVSVAEMDLRSHDGTLKNVSLVNTDDKIIISCIESVYEKEISNILSVYETEKQINLSAENVYCDNAFIPGIENTFTINVKNLGLVKTDGFKVYCSSSEHIEDMLGAAYEYTNALEAGRNVSVISSVKLPADYNQPYVYFLIEDSKGKVMSCKANVIYDSVRIGNIKKESNVPGKMNFAVDIDNYGYVNQDLLTVRITDSSSEDIISETEVSDLLSNTSQNITLSADLSTSENNLYKLEIISSAGDVLDSRLVEVTDFDYKILLGDYFCDGVVNPNDAVAILRKIAYDKTDSQRQLLAGDINGNNKIEPNDVTAILQYCAGLIRNFK